MYEEKPDLPGPSHNPKSEFVERWRSQILNLQAKPRSDRDPGQYQILQLAGLAVGGTSGLSPDVVTW